MFDDRVMGVIGPKAREPPSKDRLVSNPIGRSTWLPATSIRDGRDVSCPRPYLQRHPFDPLTLRRGPLELAEIRFHHVGPASLHGVAAHRRAVRTRHHEGEVDER